MSFRYLVLLVTWAEFATQLHMRFCGVGPCGHLHCEVRPSRFLARWHSRLMFKACAGTVVFASKCRYRPARLKKTLLGLGSSS